MRIYQSKDQVLLGFDLAASRCGWNPFDNLFFTICGAMAIATNSFPVDLTQRSLSYGYRLYKYLEHKDFSISLPGLPTNYIQLCEEHSYLFEKLERWSKDWDYLAGISPRPYKDFEASEEKLLKGMILKTPDITIYPEKIGFSIISRPINTSDYYHQIYNNWAMISKGRIHNVTFESNTVEDIINLSEESIKESIANGVYFKDNISTFTRMSRDGLKLFLGDSYKEFVRTYYVDDDTEKAKEIWNKRKEFYIEQGKNIAESINKNPWIIADPMKQHFGMFNPVITDPREWYGPDYNPVVVGLSMDRFVAWASCWYLNPKISNPNKDIFKIICDYWFIAEALDSRERLLKLEIKSSIPQITIKL